MPSRLRYSARLSTAAVATIPTMPPQAATIAHSTAPSRGAGGILVPRSRHSSTPATASHAIANGSGRSHPAAPKPSVSATAIPLNAVAARKNAFRKTRVYRNAHRLIVLRRKIAL